MKIDGIVQINKITEEVKLSPKDPTAIDNIVGRRIRQRRCELKLTQEQLAKQLGLSYQQVQKYERGVNRISAGRLYKFASVLGVSINYFFDFSDYIFEKRLQERIEKINISSLFSNNAGREILNAINNVDDEKVKVKLKQAILSIMKIIDDIPDNKAA